MDDSKLLDRIEPNLYFRNAPGSQTRREAIDQWLRENPFAEPNPLVDVTGHMLHQIYNPFANNKITDRLVMATSDGKIYKAVRMGRSNLKAEKTMLDLVKSSTTVPVPAVYGYRTSQEFEILVLEQLEGDTLENIWSTLSDEEMIDIADQVVELVEELRKLTSIVVQAAQLPSRKPLLSDVKTIEGYNLERFKAFLDDERVTEYIRARTAQLPDENFVFTHGDLDWSNIIITDKRVSGIIDFELSGFLPEYWEWVHIQRMAPYTPWNYLLSLRTQHWEKVGWEEMLELEELLNALESYSDWHLTPEERQKVRSRGWEKVTRILGDDGRPPPEVKYSDDPMSGHPCWLEEKIQHS